MNNTPPAPPQQPTTQAHLHRCMAVLKRVKAINHTFRSAKKKPRVEDIQWLIQTIPTLVADNMQLLELIQQLEQFQKGQEPSKEDN